MFHIVPSTISFCGHRLNKDVGKAQSMSLGELVSQFPFREVNKGKKHSLQFFVPTNLSTWNKTSKTYSYQDYRFQRGWIFYYENGRVYPIKNPNYGYCGVCIQLLDFKVLVFDRIYIRNCFICFFEISRFTQAPAPKTGTLNALPGKAKVKVVVSVLFFEWWSLIFSNAFQFFLVRRVWCPWTFARPVKN